MRVAARFSAPGEPYHGLGKFSTRQRLPQWTGKVVLVREHLADPLRWTKPRRVFVNSMSDLFHDGLADSAIDQVLAVMAICAMRETRGGHTFQVLTKRSRRLREYASAPIEVLRDRIASVGGMMMEDSDMWHDKLRFEMPWPLPNVWWGVSAEDQQRADERIPELLRTPAAVRFVSYEPALGQVDFGDKGWLQAWCPTCGGALAGTICNLRYRSDACGTCHSATTRLDWVIVGGESGPGARPFDIAWARSVVRQCDDSGVPCFVKQLGATPLDSDVSLSPIVLKNRKGGDMTEWPRDLRVRQFPERRLDTHEVFS